MPRVHVRSAANATARSSIGRISGGCSLRGVAKGSSSDAPERLESALEAPEFVDSVSRSVLRIFVARALAANSFRISANSEKTKALKSLELSAMTTSSATTTPESERERESVLA